MPQPTPANTRTERSGQKDIVDVAIALVVDKLSDQNALIERSINNAAATDRAQPRLRVLISRRKAEQVLGGYWELPGGKIEPNESPAQAALRELQEEVAIIATPLHALPTVEHRYDHAHIRLHPFICQHTAGEASPIEVDEVRWVTPNELADYRFPDASLPVLVAFHDWLSTHDDHTLDQTL